MATPDNEASEILGAAGISITADNLSLATKILDASNKTKDSYKEMYGYVSDLTKMYKESLRDTSAMSEINKIILSDTRLRERIQDQLLDNISKIQSTVNKERLENVKEIITKKKAIEKEKEAKKKMAKEQSDLAKEAKGSFFKFKKDKADADRLDVMRTAILAKAEKGRSEGEINALTQIEHLRQKGASATKEDIKNATEMTAKSFDDFKNEQKNAADNVIKAKKKELESAKKLKVESEMALRIEQAALANLKLKPELYKAVSENATGVLSPLGKILGASGDIKMLFTDFKNPMNMLNASTAATGLSMKVLSKSVEVAVQRFKELEETAEKFRKETGFTKDQSEKVTEYAKEINKQYAEFGITIEEATKSVKVLADLFNTTEGITKNTVKDISLMSVNLGLAQEDAAGVLQTFMGISGMTEQSAMNVMKTTAALTNGTKIPFSKVMHDVANASDDVLTSIGATPAKLIKAAMAARAMGLELNKVGSQQKRLLDYSSSITDELEASALLGRNITFMKARQLAFEGKSAESMAETLDVVKKMGKFNEMTPYQRAAVAKAAGMELKDLTKALAVDKARRSILDGNDQSAKDRLNAQDKMLKMLDEESTFSSQELLNQGDAEINTRRMQSMMSDIKNSVSAIAATFGDVFLPAIQTVGGWATSINNTIKDWSSGAKSLLALFVVGLPVAMAAGLGFFTNLYIKGIAGAVGKAAASAAADVATSTVTTAAETVAAVAPAHAAPAAAASVRGPDVSRGVSGAADAARTEGRLPSTGGSKFVTFMSNIHEGLTKITPMDLIKLAVVGGIFAGMTYLIFTGMKQLEGVDWKTLAVASAALGGFIYTVANLGPLVGFTLKPIALLSAGLGILALGLAPFVYGFTVVADAAKNFGEGMQKSASAFGEFIKNASLSNINTAVTSLNSMVDAFKSLSTKSNSAEILILESAIRKINIAVSVTGVNSARFGNGMKMGVKALKDMKDIDFSTLNKNISNLGKSLGESSGGFFTELINKLFGTDNLSKMEKLSNISAGLAISADAIKTLMNSMQNFTQVDGFAIAIDKLATSLGRLNPAIAALNTDKLSEIQKYSGTPTTALTANSAASTQSNTDTTKIEEVLNKKLDEFVKAISGMTIQMDGNVIGRAAVKYGARAGTTQ